MEKVVSTYKDILFKLQDYDLKYKKDYIYRRSHEIIEDYKISQKKLEKNKSLDFKQNKLKEILKLIENKKFDLKSMVDEINDPLILAITGVGNCGKSSFINSILKKDIAQVNDRAETWIFNILNYVENNVSNGDGIVYFEGEPGKHKTRQEIKKLIENENEMYDNSIELINKKRKEIKNENINRKEKRKKAKEIKDKYTYKSDLYKIKNFYDIELLKKYRLADTPGLGQANKSKIKDILDYYKRADGLVFVVDVDRIDQEATKKEILKVKNNSKVDTKILLIINKADNVNNFDQIELKVRKNYGQLVDYILPYSAKKVISAHKNNNSKLLKDYNYYKALKFLNKVYTSNKLIRIDKKNESINMDLEKSRKKLLDIRDDLIKKVNQYKKNIKNIREKINININSELVKIDSNVHKNNKKLDKLIRKKINGKINDNIFSKRLNRLYEELKKDNLKVLENINKEIKENLKVNIQESFVSDYQLIEKNCITDNFFEKIHKKISKISFEIDENSSFNKAVEGIGNKIKNIFSNKIMNSIGEKISDYAIDKRKNKIKKEQKRINQKFNKLSKEIKYEIRSEVKSFSSQVQSEIKKDFSNKYIIPEKITILKTIINSLTDNLALDIIKLDIIDILKKEKII
ncbi:MAG: dynamin family protein [Bacillota bacterium]